MHSVASLPLLKRVRTLITTCSALDDGLDVLLQAWDEALAFDVVLGTVNVQQPAALVYKAWRPCDTAVLEATLQDLQTGMTTLLRACLVLHLRDLDAPGVVDSLAAAGNVYLLLVTPSLPEVPERILASKARSAVYCIHAGGGVSQSLKGAPKKADLRRTRSCSHHHEAPAPDAAADAAIGASAEGASLRSSPSKDLSPPPGFETAVLSETPRERTFTIVPGPEEVTAFPVHNVVWRPHEALFQRPFLCPGSAVLRLSTDLAALPRLQEFLPMGMVRLPMVLYALVKMRQALSADP